MPAARPVPGRNRPSPVPDEQQRRVSPHMPSTGHRELIVLSSSDDERQAGSSKLKAVKVPRTPSRPQGRILDVLEISSDEDDIPLAMKRIPVRRDNIEFKVKLEGLEKELAELKRCNQFQSNEIIDLNKQILDQRLELERRDQKARTAAQSIPSAQFEELVTCEICAAKMWKPFILPNCGHTYCETCLRDWFSTTLAQHMHTHPDYRPNQAPQPPAYIMDLLHNPYSRAQAEEIIAAHYSHPEYTCPACREPVRDRPTENFALKAIVRIIATAQGEASPQKLQPQAKGRGRKGKQAAKKPEGPWDAFFPSKPA